MSAPRRSQPVATYRTDRGRLALVWQSADPRDRFRFLAFESARDSRKPGGWRRMGSTPRAAMAPVSRQVRWFYSAGQFNGGRDGSLNWRRAASGGVS